MNIIESLRELPELIRQAEMQFWNLQNELAELKKNQELWKFNEIGKITKEVDKFGHRRFPNDALRNAELARRKATDEKWQQMEEREKILNRKVGMAKIERSYQQNRLKAAIAIAQLAAAGIYTPEIPKVNRRESAKSKIKNGFKEDIDPNVASARMPVAKPPNQKRKQDYWETIRRKMEKFAAPGDPVFLIDRYRSKTPLRCELCGHPEIVNINVIKNMRTGETLKIGSVCVTRYEKVRKKRLSGLTPIQSDKLVRITRKASDPYYDDLWPGDEELRETLTEGHNDDEEYDFEFDPSIDWGPAEDDQEVPKWYGGIDSPFPDS